MPPPRLSFLFLFLLLSTIIRPTHSFLHLSITTTRPPRLAHQTLHATPPASASFLPSRNPTTLQEFQSWLWTKGGLNLSASPLELRLSPTGIGLYTTRPIEKDQILLAIPQSLILTPTLPLPFLEEMASHADLNDLGRLALRLLYEASAGGGHFLPYLRVLPARDEMHLPFLWDDDNIVDQSDRSRRREPLLSFLAPSPLYDDILEARAEMKEEMTLLREACEKEKAEGAAARLLLPFLTWETWSWARAITMSRPYMFVDDSPSSSPSSSSLQLLPLIDMANHDDSIRYAVQKGDGIFTAKEDIQLVADRAYPQTGQEYMITYGPLSSASKLYSFGYLEEVPLPSSSSSSPSSPPPTVILPAQGTALFVVSLKKNEREQQPSLHQTKQNILSSINLTPEKQRIEVATRTQTHTPTSGPTLARVVIEDHVTVDVYEGEKDRKKGKDGGVYGVPDGGVERLKRYLRLKHLSQDDVDVLLSSASTSQKKKNKQDTHTQSSPGSSPPPSTLIWSLLSSPLRKEVELAVALDIVSLCSRELARVEHTLTHICTVLNEEEENLSNTNTDTDTHTHTDMYIYRLGVVKTLLHGELLALRAVAELFMTAVEEMEREGGE